MTQDTEWYLMNLFLIENVHSLSRDEVVYLILLMFIFNFPLSTRNLNKLHKSHKMRVRAGTNLVTHGPCRIY